MEQFLADYPGIEQTAKYLALGVVVVFLKIVTFGKTKSIDDPPDFLYFIFWPLALVFTFGILMVIGSNKLFDLFNKLHVMTKTKKERN